MASRFRKVRGILSSNTDGADFPDGLPNGKKSKENLIQNLSKEIDEMCGSGLDGEKLNQAHIIRYDIVRYDAGRAMDGKI